MSGLAGAAEVAGKSRAKLTKTMTPFAFPSAVAYVLAAFTMYTRLRSSTTPVTVLFPPRPSSGLGVVL